LLNFQITQEVKNIGWHYFKEKIMERGLYWPVYLPKPKTIPDSLEPNFILQQCCHHSTSGNK
jgi:hypothetical protein